MTDLHALKTVDRCLTTSKQCFSGKKKSKMSVLMRKEMARIIASYAKVRERPVGITDDLSECSNHGFRQC